MDSFYLREHLTEEGRNGGATYYLKGNQAFHDAELKYPLPAAWKDEDARVFQIVPEHRQQSPEITARQMGEAISTIQRVVGQEKVDVLAHSMAGIASRIYLSQGGQGIGKLLMAGTPNQGTRSATMARLALRWGTELSQRIGGFGPQAAPALDWLYAVQDGNQRLAELNGNWAEDQKGLEAAKVVGSTGRLTPAACPQDWARGDGLIDDAAIAVGDTPVTILPGNWTQGHTGLMNDRQAFREMRDFFGWKS